MIGELLNKLDNMVICKVSKFNSMFKTREKGLFVESTDIFGPTSFHRYFLFNGSDLRMLDLSHLSQYKKDTFRIDYVATCKKTKKQFYFKTRKSMLTFLKLTESTYKEHKKQGKLEYIVRKEPKTSNTKGETLDEN